MKDRRSARDAFCALAVPLARAGMLAQARGPADAMVNASTETTLLGRGDAEGCATLLRAMMGDLPGALAAAGESGPMVTLENPMGQLRAGLIFGFLPSPRISTVPGPQAYTLVSIAVNRASAGDIEGALRAEAQLDSAGPAVAQIRGSALNAIAMAQLRAVDPESALATAQRIGWSKENREALLTLVATPGTQAAAKSTP